MPRRPDFICGFDGTRWEVPSGLDGQNSPLDIEHNPLVVDAQAPDNVYVAADIGVWHSSDRGLNWTLMQNGLPDAPVFDLQIDGNAAAVTGRYPWTRCVRVLT